MDGDSEGELLGWLDFDGESLGLSVALSKDG